MVVRRSALLAAAGLAVGTGVAIVGSGSVESLLFHVSPRAPVVLGSVGVLLFGVAVLASLVPAMRATRTDPNSVLRAD
jgi:ABC-type antimicrobial peptide transport system permease subunit